MTSPASTIAAEWAALVASYEPETNVRWIACHFAIGRRPAAYEFTCWVGEQWRAFAKEHGITSRDRHYRDPHITMADKTRCLELTEEEVHAKFDAWLVERVLAKAQADRGAACACGRSDKLDGFDRCEDCLIASGAIPDPKDLTCSYCGAEEPCDRDACRAADRYETRMP